MIKNVAIYRIGLVSLLILGIGLSRCGRQPYQRHSRLIMGTVIEITAQDNLAINKAFEEIERIDALLSTYNRNSEISRLNRKRKLEVSDEVLALIKKAKYFYRATDGAFDITVGPLVKLWDIKKNMRKDVQSIRIPSDSKIKNVLSSVGSNFIEIDEKKSIIRLKNRNAVLDLGGIAKGYAVDRAIAVLKESGTRSALVNAGGDIYCLGRKLGSFWNVGVQNPGESRAISDNLRLKNRAVATSGDYEQFFMYANKRYSHIIDPRTGYPVDNNISSVTVIAPDCMTADVLATAVFVLGEQEGKQLAKQFKNTRIKIISK